MVVFEIIAALVLMVAAVGCLIYTVVDDKATTIPLGVAVVLGIGGGWLFSYGLHGFHARYHSKHVAILRDLTDEGFRVRYEDVYARGGNNLYGTEADIGAGPCLWSFNTTKIDGTWRLTLPSRDGNGVVVLSPADVAELPGVCAR